MQRLTKLKLCDTQDIGRTRVRSGSHVRAREDALTLSKHHPQCARLPQQEPRSRAKRDPSRGELYQKMHPQVLISTVCNCRVGGTCGVLNPRQYDEARLVYTDSINGGALIAAHYLCIQGKIANEARMRWKISCGHPSICFGTLHDARRFSSVPQVYAV